MATPVGSSAEPVRLARCEPLRSPVERSCFVHVRPWWGAWMDAGMDGSSSNPYRSMEGGSVDELLDVAVERPVLDQFEVEVGRTLEDRG